MASFYRARAAETASGAEISGTDGHITLVVGRIPEVHEWLQARF